MNARIPLRTSAATAIFLSSCFGCAGTQHLKLEQPFAPGSQRSLDLPPLRSGMHGSKSRTACAATFALPGSSAGPRAYVLYLSLPVSDDFSHTVERSNPNAAQVLLIQEIGALAGKSTAVSGTVQWERDWLLAPRNTLVFDAVCEDGTRMAGRLAPRADTELVVTIERQYDADIQLLHAAASRPAASAPAASPTPPRKVEDGA